MEFEYVNDKKWSVDGLIYNGRIFSVSCKYEGDIIEICYIGSNFLCCTILFEIISEKY